MDSEYRDMTTCPECGATLPPEYLPTRDMRAVHWRARVRLYPEGSSEPAADTDAEAEPGAPGAKLYLGLPAIAEDLAALAAWFHQADTPGLGHTILLHRLKSIRPTLARNAGRGVWRVPYIVTGAGAWIARVDIQREETTL